MSDETWEPSDFIILLNSSEVFINFTFSQIPKGGYLFLGNIHNTIHSWHENEEQKNGKFLNHFILLTLLTVILLHPVLLCSLLINVSFKWTSAITGNLALMKAKRTHYFGFLNGNHNFQLESRNEKMEMDGLSQLLTFTCRYLLRNALNIHHQKSFIHSIFSDILQRLLEILKQKKKSICSQMETPKPHWNHVFSSQHCIFIYCVNK